MKLLASHLTSLPSRQRGAFSVLAAGTLTLVILFSALALDTGRLYWERQEVQRIADLAALDLATSTDFYEVNDGATNTVLRNLANTSAGNNGFDWQAEENSIVTNVGALQIDRDTRLNRFIPAADAPPDLAADAVEVLVTRQVPTSIVANLASLFPGSTLDSTTRVSGYAVAQRPLNVSFSAGTTLLTQDFSDSPLLQALLAEMLGLDIESLALDAVGFQGLANLNLSLLQLQEALNIATFDELLSSELSVGTLADVALSVLDSDDTLLSPDVLNAIDIIIDSPIGNNLLTLGELVDIHTPDDVDTSGVLAAKISLGQLLNTALFLVNDEHVITVPELELNVGEIVVAKLSAHILEPPQIAIGPIGCASGILDNCTRWHTEAKTAQIQLDVSLALQLGIPPLGLADVTVDLDLQAGTGRARIEEITKTSPTTYNAVVNGYTSVAEVQKLEVSTTILEVLEVIDISINGIDPSISIPGPTQITGIQWPSPAIGTITGGDILGSLGNAISGGNMSVCVVICLNGVSLPASLFNTVDDSLNTLLTPLGINLNEMQVEIIDIHQGAVELAI